MVSAKCRVDILRKSRFTKLRSLPAIYISFTMASVLSASRGELMNRGDWCAETKAGQKGRVWGHGKAKPEALESGLFSWLTEPVYLQRQHVLP